MSDLEIKIDRVSTRAFLKALGGDEEWNVPPMARSVIACLRLTPGAMVALPDLVEFLWGDKEDGGPLAPEWNIRVHVCLLRRRGFAIETHWGQGLRLLENGALPETKFPYVPEGTRSEYLARVRSRQVAALVMRRSGLLYREIADRLGFADFASAWAAVRRAKRREELHQHRKAA